jgi:hypothetical protein
MATLTNSEFTRSTAIVPASRPRLSMPLSPAVEMIMVATRPAAVSARLLDRIAGPQHDVRADSLINDNSITTTIDIPVQLGSRKPCGDVDDLGAPAAMYGKQGAFVTSLGDRPPSPPV